MAIDFGTGLAVISDWPKLFTYAMGLQNLGNNLCRRLQTPRGSLAWDLNCGWDVRQLFRAAFNESALPAYTSAISAECEKDARVLSASTEINYIRAAGTMVISVTVTTAQGPFLLVLSVDNLTVQLLRFAALASNP